MMGTASLITESISFFNYCCVDNEFNSSSTESSSEREYLLSFRLDEPSDPGTFTSAKSAVGVRHPRVWGDEDVVSSDDKDRGGDLMRKRAFVVAVVGLAAVLVAGGLVASNMGFKANYALVEAGGASLTGTNSLALPYNQQTNLVDAESLIADINADAGAAVVASISRFVKTTDSLEFYTGFSGANFSLTPGEGYLVTVSGPVNYIIVGSHNPSLGINLDSTGTNGSLTGSQLWSYPYHAVAASAEDLINEINAHAGGSVVASVSRFVRTTDGLEFYTGFSGVNFSLAPGEAYNIVVTADVTNYVPLHF